MTMMPRPVLVVNLDLSPVGRCLFRISGFVMVEYAPFIGMLVFFAYLFVLDLDVPRAIESVGSRLLRLRGNAGKECLGSSVASCGEDSDCASDQVEQFEEVIAALRRRSGSSGPRSRETKEKPRQ